MPIKIIGLGAVPGLMLDLGLSFYPFLAPAGSFNPSGQSLPLLNLTCLKIGKNLSFLTILISNILPESAPDPNFA